MASKRVTSICRPAAYVTASPSIRVLLVAIEPQRRLLFSPRRARCSVSRSLVATDSAIAQRPIVVAMSDPRCSIHRGAARLHTPVAQEVETVLEQFVRFAASGRAETATLCAATSDFLVPGRICLNSCHGATLKRRPSARPGLPYHAGGPARHPDHPR